ncbi:hypothetical protein ACFXKI_00705 [Streptomyces mirabilis]|uniref:hypothetical protein n=1 Tax=Streptomyces mirabilis TaxID=68239 RepID=UPI0036D13D66
MRTLADHSRTIAAMHALATEYPLLPAADIRIVPRVPDELMIECYDSLASFEAWREALHADIDAVEHQVTRIGQIHLIAEAKFDGVTVIIHGYTPQARPQLAKAVAA